MMRHFICIWFLIQVFTIGPTVALIQAQVHNKTLECVTKPVSEVQHFFAGLVFPLLAFVPESSEITEYCNAK